MSALDLAVDVATDLAALPLPEPVHAQLGDLVIDCAGTYVTVTTITEIDPTGGSGAGNCDMIVMGNVTVIVARDCSFVANDNGTTDWDKQNKVSVQLDADTAVLWDQTEKWRADAWYLAPGLPPTMTMAISGGLATVTLTLLLPVP